MSLDPEARQLYALIKHYNLDAFNPELARIASLIEKSQLPEGVAGAYLLMIYPLIEHARDHPMPLHRPPSAEELDAEGPPDIEVGSLVHAPELRVGFRLRQIGSVLISGNAGSGKTTLIRTIIRRIVRFNELYPTQRITLIIIDPKLDYVDLAAELGPECLVQDVHDPSTRIASGPPDGVPPHAWINILATMFAARSGMIAGWTCFANMIRWILPLMNPGLGSPLNWPSPELLLQVAKASTPTLWASKPQYHDTNIQALESLVSATQVLKSFHGVDVDHDVICANRHLILLIPAFDPSWVRRLIIEIVLATILYSRVFRGEKRASAKSTVLVCHDEMEQDGMAASDADYPDNMGILARLLRIGREYRIGAIMGLSRMSGASPYVLGEPHYHFIFTQSDSISIREAMRTLVLPAGSEALLPSLTPGTCIYRQAQTNWSHPMLVKIDPPEDL